MNRIDAKFRQLRKDKKKAFIAFITAGYPSLEATYDLVLAFSRIGVDIIELGVPFSDPMADGPVIQEASQAALRKTNIDNILDLVSRCRRRTQVPICLMTYYNPVFCFKEARFIRRASLAGVDGLILPDLPPEEGASLQGLAAKYNLDIIHFLSPTTAPGRIRHITKMARGFIYYVSLTGVTGERKALPADILKRIRQAKRSTNKPVCAGFGISSRIQVEQVQQAADGVIVGSAIVRKIRENIGRPDLVKRVLGFVSILKG
ncbi:MAG: tryptophan synthase subunit alpha [Candidatus Omnitrophota bacterium]